MIEFDPGDKVCDMQRLAEFEQPLRVRLPANCRSWLETTHSLRTTGMIDVCNGFVERFLGCSAGLKWDVTTWHDEVAGGFIQMIPPGFLVVGMGSGGSLCLLLAAEDFGSVWWADFDLGDEIASVLNYDGPIPQIMRRVANNFQEFLDTYSLPEKE